MTTFSSMPTLSSNVTSGPDALGLSGVHSMGGGQMMGMDPFDQDVNFDESLLDSVNGGLPPLPFTPTGYDFEGFTTAFEDPFSYQIRPYDVPPVPENEVFNREGGSRSSSPQELDNKLLGFGVPLPGKATLVDENGQFIDPNMTAELYGMFFVAEDVFGGETTGRPLELTCYRRNLWQCSGQITLPRHVSNCVDEQGQQIPIVDVAASITAIESIEGKATEIISIPWKSSNPALAGNNGGEEAKVAGSPPTVPLDLSGGQELEGNRVSAPVSWKRLQFKHATANNGRRKGLQQHYVVQINLLAKTKTGDYIKIAEVQSGPVIVRGRSPRNFDSRKDVPLTGEKKLERRNTDSSGSGSGPKQQPRQEISDLAQNLQRYHSLGNIQQTTDWSAPQPFTSPNPNTHAHKKLAISPGLGRPPVPAWSTDSGLSTPRLGANFSPPTPLFSSGKTLGSNSNIPRGGPMLPINLSLSEDERSPNRSTRSDTSDPTQSPLLPKSSGGVPAGGPNSSGSPLESADMLYEYFPLSLDDWMPPVDAVYRPHVVHHTNVPPELKAQQSMSRTKRYFAD
ncbi:protein pacG [Rhypophila decipiens]|uniref:Protein pacG n=1 Tax=Rhypophila decipiens TaxID=261697 RepID=A0AAN7BBK2_9PEZI|nr:protein pacG [Rhypophila decipiens]